MSENEKENADRTPAIRSKVEDNKHIPSLFVRKKNGNVSGALNPFKLGINLKDMCELYDNGKDLRTVFLRYDNKVMEAIMVNGGHTVHNPLPLVSREFKKYLPWRLLQNSENQLIFSL